MAEKYLTQVTAQTDALADGDLFLITDVSDTSQKSDGTNKRLTFTQIKSGLDTAGYIKLTDISVTDSGGEGSLSYDNTTGVFTYTGPSAAEVRAHLSVGSEATASGDGAIAYNSSTGVFTYTPPTLAGLNGSIDDLTDVTLTSTATNDILRWNGSTFVNTDAPTLDALQFDLTAAETAAVGKLAWNSEDLTLDLGMNASVTLQIGQEQLARIKATTTIRNGMAVYISGVTGGSDNLEGTPFSADSASGVDELRFLGIATEALSTNAVGFVTTFGKVRGVNGTTYASGGIRDNADTESWSVGDILYASPNIAGTLTSVVPTAPDREMPIAIVLKAPAETNLTLFVRAEHGYHLNELHDVLISGTPADNELLAYDSASGNWINQTAAEAGIAATGHTHATSDITSGTFADARIAQSNVTQHQAALSITESQISDLGSYITASSTDTLTNKTFDANGIGNSLSNIEVADLASSAKTGSDTKVVTGTAGTSGDLAQWNADGDLVDGPTPPSGTIVGTSDSQALTNKTIDGDLNTLQNIAYSSIKSTSRTGSDVKLVTGTAGASGDLSIWNADGDLVDGPTPPTGTIVGTSDSQTLTNKTIDANSNTITNIGASEVESGIINDQTESTNPIATDTVLVYTGSNLRKVQLDNLPPIYKLGELQDVTLQDDTEDSDAVSDGSLNNGELLVYDASSDIWINDDTLIVDHQSQLLKAGDLIYDNLPSAGNAKLYFEEVTDTNGKHFTIETSGISASDTAGSTGGNLILSTGPSQSSYSGETTGSVQIVTGGASGSTSATTGSITIQTGDVASGTTGSITLRTGMSSSTDVAGDIVFDLGIDGDQETYSDAIPQSTKVFNFGTASNAWKGLYSNAAYFVETGLGSNYVAFTAPSSIASNITWTLPNADGSSGQVLSTNGSGTLSWATASGGGGISNVVEDTTPQLGGQLDVNGQAIGDGTLELLTFTEDASAVNHVNIENEATGSGPIISAAGDDTNIDLNLAGKGTGNISLGNMTFDADQSIGSGQDNYVLTYDHSAGTISLEAASGGISNVVEDTTPQLGGQLDVNGQAIGDGTRALLGFVEDASAVNYIEIENEATASGPIIRSTGTDTNVDLNLQTKGSGNINLETLIYSESSKKLFYSDITGAGTGTALAITSAGVDAGNTNGATGGALTLSSGDAADLTGGNTGNVTLASGLSTTGSSGSVTISSGNSAGGGDSGSITLQTGSVQSSGSAGDIILAPTSDGTGGTYGDVRPDGDGVQNLGTASNRWKAFYQTTNYFVETGAGTNYVAFTAPSSIASDVTWTLPNADGSNGQVLSTNGSGTLSWATASGGGISNVVEDTTPQLGGQLDVNGNAIGDGTLELLTFTEDASAVNHVNIENEATGSGPIISAAGDDTNIDLNLRGKATGNVIFSDGTDVTKTLSFELSGATTSTKTTLTASQTAARTITLPDATDTLVGKATTDTFTNKTFDANGTGNSLSNVETADIASGSKSGSDTTLVTGTAGTNGNLVSWNADGDAVDSSIVASNVALTDGDTYTGTHDFGGATLEIPNGAAPSLSVAGQIALDTSTTDHTALLKYHDGTNEFVIPAILSSGLSTTDNDVIAYNAANNRFEMEAQSGSGGGISNVVEDTTPQLGGQLDVNGQAIGDGTRELLTFTEDVSAVNHVNIENQATGGGPIISAAGDDTNIDLNLSAKGTGDISLGTMVFDADQTIGAGQDNYVLTYDNATGKISLEAAAGGGGGISNVVEDTTPQLGGNLDVNGNSIVSVTNGNITLAPDGTGVVQVNDQLVVGSSSTALGTTTIYGHSASDEALLIKAASAQTADLVEIQNNSGTKIFSINSDGSTLNLASSNGVIAHTGNLFYVRRGTSNAKAFSMDVFGSNGFRVSESEHIGFADFTSGVSGAANTTIRRIADAHLAINGASATDTCQVTVGSNTSLGTLTIYGHSASDEALVIKAASSQSADILQIQNSGGTELVTVDSSGKLGVNSASPNATLTVNGSMSLPIESISATDTLDDTNHTVLVDANLGDITVNLPAASGSTGKIFIIKKTDSSSNNVIIDPNAAETIDGSSTFTFNSQYRSVTIQCDGSNWHIISSYIVNY